MYVFTRADTIKGVTFVAVAPDIRWRCARGELNLRWRRRSKHSRRAVRPRPTGAQGKKRGVATGPVRHPPAHRRQG